MNIAEEGHETHTAEYKINDGETTLGRAMDCTTSCIVDAQTHYEAIADIIAHAETNYLEKKTTSSRDTINDTLQVINHYVLSNEENY